MTFEQLNDQLGAETIYSGTSVDQATQGALLEWCFDRVLTISDESEINTWLRYYRRNLNMFYPIYQDRLRIESVRSNMDPFITDFMERIHEDTTTSTSAGTRVKNGTHGDSDSEQTITDNTGVRTPDLTTTGSNSDTQTNSSTSSNSSRTLGETTSAGTDSTEDNTKTRGLNIQYPEANLNGVPVDIDGFPSTVDYAEGESDTFGKQEHEGSSTSSQTTDNTTTDSGSQNSTSTASGTNSVRETGHDTNKFDGNVVRTKSSNGNNTESETNTGSSSDSRSGEDTEQGRHESPADILPRAIQAITSTNSIKWFVDTLQICFDNYHEI